MHHPLPSGLDSQTAWSICRLMRKLANNGQAILCTIHQPSAILMQEFDRLLFLASGGRTVYFGDIGENCTVLTRYFESHGAPPCPPQANPAEWMLEVIGAAPGHHSDLDWHETWRTSENFRAMHKELDAMRDQLAKKSNVVESAVGLEEFAMPLSSQLWYCFKRVGEQYWRTPSYIYSKATLCIFTVSAPCTLYLLCSTLNSRGFSFASCSTKLIICCKDCKTKCSCYSCS